MVLEMNTLEFGGGCYAWTYCCGICEKIVTIYADTNAEAHRYGNSYTCPYDRCQEAAKLRELLK